MQFILYHPVVISHHLFFPDMSLQMMNKKIYRNKVALNIQLVHHILCGVLFGLIFYKAADDGFRMFDHLKYCIGVVFFLSYTQVIVPILSCKCSIR